MISPTSIFSEINQNRNYQQPQAPFTCLPGDVIRMIFEKLSIADSRDLQLTCRQFAVCGRMLSGKFNLGKMRELARMEPKIGSLESWELGPDPVLDGANLYYARQNNTNGHFGIFQININTLQHRTISNDKANSLAICSDHILTTSATEINQYDLASGAKEHSHPLTITTRYPNQVTSAFDAALGILAATPLDSIEIDVVDLKGRLLQRLDSNTDSTGAKLLENRRCWHMALSPGKNGFSPVLFADFTGELPLNSKGKQFIRAYRLGQEGNEITRPFNMINKDVPDLWNRIDCIAANADYLALATSNSKPPFRRVYLLDPLELKTKKMIPVEVIDLEALLYSKSKNMGRISIDSLKLFEGFLAVRVEGDGISIYETESGLLQRTISVSHLTTGVTCTELLPTVIQDGLYAMPIYEGRGTQNCKTHIALGDFKTTQVIARFSVPGGDAIYKILLKNGHYLIAMGYRRVFIWHIKNAIKPAKYTPEKQVQLRPPALLPPSIQRGQPLKKKSCPIQ